MRWFVSYCFEDERKCCDLLEKWAKEGRLGDDIVIFVDREDKRFEGEKAVKEYLKKELQKSHGLMVLVGDNCHNRPWMDYEIDVANSIQLPIIPIRVPNTTGASPKAIRNQKLIAFEPNAIKKAIDNSKE